jgi:hypothetical protein
MGCLSAYFLGREGSRYATFLPVIEFLNVYVLIQCFNPKSIRTGKSSTTFKEEIQDFYEKAFHRCVFAK